uniref:Ion transport domain-containing protein n=1 Tax=Salix viminalis TaxID=40686 RepID=A0A6N2NBF4_SALVM
MEFKKEKLVRVFAKATGLMIIKTWTRCCMYIKHQCHWRERNTGNKVPGFGRFKVFSENHHEPYWRERILDLGRDVILKWNMIFLFSCLTALFVDQIVFFYLPSVTNKEKSSCMDTDLNLGITVTCFRTFVYVFYIVHIVIKLRTAYVSPGSRVFGRGELVIDLLS